MAITVQANWEVICTTNRLNYVSDNITFHLDGICNTRSGHSTTTTTWQDLSGNDQDGMIGDGVTINSDNMFFNFTRTGNTKHTSNAQIASSINGTNYTVEYVGKYGGQTSGGYNMLASMGTPNASRDSYFFVGRLDSALMFGFFNDNYYAAWNGPYTNIHTATFVYVNGQQNIYVNGEKLGARTPAGKVSVNTSQPFYIGFYDDNAAFRGMHGNVYSFRMYDRALSQSEITQNYNNDRTRFNF